MIHEDFHYGTEEHEQYLRDGYHVFPRFLSGAGLQRCLDEIDGMLERLEPGRKADEIYSAHHQEQWIWELATQPKLLDMVEWQIGPNIVLWSSHLLCKAPQTGREVPWHQDAPYWNVTGPLAGGIWIAFDDITADNGGMAVLPGWHNKGRLPIRHRDQAFFNDEIDPSALPSDPDAIKVQYLFPAGGMATHDTMIPHNSAPNRSNKWRKVLGLRYMDGAGVMGDKEYPDYRTGEKFQRRYFLVRGEAPAGSRVEQSPFEDARSR